MSFAECLGTVAPVYNLALVIIVIILFIKLFRTPRNNKQIYVHPWKMLFFALSAYILEEIFTILKKLDIFYLPSFINPLFEMVILATFIYMLLKQKMYLKVLKNG